MTLRCFLYYIAFFVSGVLLGGSRGELFDKTLKQVKELISSAKYDSALMVISHYRTNPDRQISEVENIRLLMQVGNIMCLTHKSDECIEYYKRVLIESKKINDSGYMGKALLGIGAGYYFQGKNDSALHYYLMALPIFEETKDSVNLLGTRSNVGLLLDEKGDFETAIRYYQEYVEHQIKLENYKGATGAYYNMGLFCMNRNQLETAVDFYEISDSIATVNKYSSDRAKAILGLAKSYNLMGRYEEANKKFILLNEVSTEFLHEDYSDKILELETKFRTAEIERDNALKQAQIETQEQRMIYLYIIAAFLGLSILAVYLYNEQRKKVIRALALQREHENS
ncbi:MAG: tetratricopeptide repeat protein, partial [Marinoscillum sp.]